MSARAIAAAAALVLGLALPPAGGAHVAAPRPDAARGIVLDGLVRAERGSECAGVGWEIRARGQMLGCTHGPDPAPAEVDVRAERSLADLQRDAGRAPALSCVGDGVSGPRIQAVYAYPSDRASRFAEVAPLIEAWSGDVAEVVRASAERTGGAREARFVTDGACRPTVLEVEVSPEAAESFGQTVLELGWKGLARSDRKYLVWMDATTYCGIAEMYEDDRPERWNRNNGAAAPGLVARVDAGCWPTDRRVVAAHELVHTLGGVQPGAPNASRGGHCLDEHDLMCYADAPGVLTRLVCGDFLGERRLDCNGDDYFSTAPARGTWLAAHWNTANSHFLDGGDRDAPAAPANARVVDAGTTSVTVAWDGPTDAVAFRLSTGLDQTVAASSPATLGRLACGRPYTIALDALDGGGNASPRVTLTAATLACPDVAPPVVRAAQGRGTRGGTVALRYSVSDAGETAETLTMLGGARRLARRATPFAAPGPRIVRWRIPARARTPLRFCVRAADRAGNVSEAACARIALRENR